MAILKDNFERIKNALQKIFQDGIPIVNLSDLEDIHSFNAQLVTIEIDESGLVITLTIQFSSQISKEFFYWDKDYPDLDQFLLAVNIDIQLFQIRTLADRGIFVIGPQQINFLTARGSELVFKDVKQVWDIPGMTFNYGKLVQIHRNANEKEAGEYKFFTPETNRELKYPTKQISSPIKLGGISHENFLTHFNLDSDNQWGQYGATPH